MTDKRVKTILHPTTSPSLSRRSDGSDNDVALRPTASSSSLSRSTKLTEASLAGAGIDEVGHTPPHAKILWIESPPSTSPITASSLCPPQQGNSNDDLFENHPAGRKQFCLFLVPKNKSVEFHQRINSLGIATTMMSAAPESSPQEATATRNKQKFRADVSFDEPRAPRLEYPRTTADYVGTELMSHEMAGDGGGVNMELLRSMASIRSGFHDRTPQPAAAMEELSESQVYMSWTGVNKVQLEEVLLKSLDATFDSAVHMVTVRGYSEAAARAAVVRVASRYSWKVSLTGLGQAAVDVLKSTQGDLLSREGASVDDMRKVERAVLRSLVAVVGEALPSCSTEDVMFCLLMSDMNVAQACTMDYRCTHAPLPGLATQVIAQPVARDHEPGARPTMPGNTPSVSENTIALPDRSSDGQPFAAAATHSFKDGKSVTSKREISKRESLHRQKFTSVDKCSRASKGPLRSVKHSSSGSASLGMKCGQVPDSSSCSGLKGSSKVGKGFSAVVTGTEASMDPSYTTLVSSTSTLETNRASSSNPLPAASTDLSLSLLFSSGIPIQSPDQDCSNIEVKGCSSKTNFSYDEHQEASIRHDRRDELILMLLQRQKELQAEMQYWTDWAQDKVIKVAHRLKEEKEELQSLRKEKEESNRLQEERQYTLEVSNRKKLLEMESASSRASSRVVKADALACRREAENAQLRIQLGAAKGRVVESATKFQELSKKDEKTLEGTQHRKSERAALQDQLATEKSRLSRVQQQLHHGKEKKDRLQARSKHVEAEKVEAMARVAWEKKERERIETALRSEENSLRLEAENEKRRYESEVRALEQQISQLKVSLMMNSASVAATPKWGAGSYRSLVSELGGRKKSTNAPVLGFGSDDDNNIRRDRECVMCLSEEAVVVFLPCAHQVLCVGCNDLHAGSGVKDCPACRAPVQRRVHACFAD